MHMRLAVEETILYHTLATLKEFSEAMVLCLFTYRKYQTRLRRSALYIYDLSPLSFPKFILV